MDHLHVPAIFQTSRHEYDACCHSWMNYLLTEINLHYCTAIIQLSRSILAHANMVGVPHKSGVAKHQYGTCQTHLLVIRWASIHWWHGEMMRNSSLVPSLIISGPPAVVAIWLLFNVVTIILMCVNYCNCWITMKKKFCPCRTTVKVCHGILLPLTGWWGAWMDVGAKTKWWLLDTLNIIRSVVKQTGCVSSVWFHQVEVHIWKTYCKYP